MMNALSKIHTFFLPRTFAGKLLFCFVLAMSSVLLVQAQRNAAGKTELASARELYESGLFHESILVLAGDQGEPVYRRFPPDNRFQAYKLLARNYLALDSMELVDKYVRAMVMIAPEYDANAAGDPAVLVEEIEEMKDLLFTNLTSSVSKIAEKIEEVAATVDIVEGHEIRRRGYLDLESVFHDVSGFDISRSNGFAYSNIYQRGYRSGSSTDRTLILVDGIEDNDLWSNTAWITRQYPLSNLKKVEILHGPVSTTYGANAFLGVINLVPKTAADIVGPVGNFGVDGMAGYGEWNSTYADLTSAVILDREKNMNFTLTGRYYRSDEYDISNFDPIGSGLPYDTLVDWALPWGDPLQGRDRYKGFLTVRDAGLETLGLSDSLPPSMYYFPVYDSTGKLKEVRPTDLGIAAARAWDSTALVNGEGQMTSLPYYDATEDWYLGGKLNLGRFNVGFQTWSKAEGLGAAVRPGQGLMGTARGSTWSYQHSFAYARYEQRVASWLTLSNLSSFKIHKTGEGNRDSFIKGYYNRGYTILALDSVRVGAAQDFPTIEKTYYYTRSNQFRNEFKLTMNPFRGMNIVSGVEFRSALLQGDYVVSDTANPDENGEVQGEPEGGNFHLSRDWGFYSQANYRFRNNLILTVGGRLDNNKLDENGGYGTFFSPRFAAVYAHPFDEEEKRKMIFKGIFSRAFKDASPFNKYSTFSESVQPQVPNPNLTPEKVTNIEGSAAFKNDKVGSHGSTLNLEGVLYHARYQNTPELTSVIDEESGAPVNKFVHQNYYFITGIQLNTKFEYAIPSGGRWSFYGNYSYTRSMADSILDATAEGPASTTAGVRYPTADIAPHKFNLGSNMAFSGIPLNINLRMNYVGRKLTGANTTASLNPFDEIRSYWTMNGAITYSPFRKKANEQRARKAEEGIQVQFIVNNILNRRYYDPGVSNFGFYAAQVLQNPRNIHLRLSYTFE